MSKAILVKNSAIISEEKIFLLTDHEEVEEKSKSINENPKNPDQSNAIILFDTKFTEYDSYHDFKHDDRNENKGMIIVILEIQSLLEFV